MNTIDMESAGGVENLKRDQSVLGGGGNHTVNASVQVVIRALKKSERS